MSMIWCGIDWAERDHDVALVDDEGNLVAKRRIGDDAAGFTMLLELLAEHGATSDGQQATPIAIETASGLLPAALLASGFTVYAINPLAVSRYRDRYAVSRAKSNAGDAFVLANVLRTDRNAHRPVPNDSNSCGRSGCWLAPSRTRSGIGSRHRTSSVRCCASTTRRR